jgi:hypothetical protein
MFSFGLIKTRTALAGAVTFVRDPVILKALQQHVREYPSVSTREFYQKWLRALLLQTISRPLLFGTIWRLLTMLQCDPDLLLSQATRGFRRGDLLQALRRRPHPATVRFLQSRLASDSDARIERRAEHGRKSLAQLPTALGRSSQSVYWALPITVPDREAFIVLARAAGFDVSYRASSVTCHGVAPTAFSRSLEDAVFLPIGTTMPSKEWQRLLTLVQKHLERRAEDDV